MKPSLSKTKPKGLSLQNKLNNTKKLVKQQESETHLDAEMHIKLRSGSQTSQRSLKIKQQSCHVKDGEDKPMLANCPQQNFLRDICEMGISHFPNAIQTNRPLRMKRLWRIKIR